MKTQTTMDLSLEELELERLVKEKRRRLELLQLQQLSEIDKRLEAQQPQDAAQSDTIVEIETISTQIETTQSNKKAWKQPNLFAAFKMTSGATLVASR
jgi:hypothetical protein